MKKTFWITLIALVLSVFIAAPALAVYQDMHADVYKWTGGYNANGSPGLEKLTTGITYKVLAHDSDTAETLYAYNDRGMTAKTNPITTTIFAANDRIEFKVDPTETADTYVDLIVTDTVGGYSTVVKHFNKHTHVVVIDERPNIMHHGVIWYTCSTTGEVDTGIDFVADTFIHDVRSEVVTTSTGGTISAGLLSTGTGGNATGFLATRSAATAGFTADTGVVTAGASTDYTAASTYGALLYTAITGTGATWTTKEASGGRSYLGHVVTGTNTGALTYTCSTTTNSGAGYLHYFFTRMR
jgi:hypothetical protein